MDCVRTPSRDLGDNFDSILLVVREELIGVLVARLDLPTHSLATP